MKWIISNHKDSLIDEKYKLEVIKILDSKVHLVICPNDSQLLQFKTTNYSLGSQDIAGSFSIDELKNMSVKYAIIGHSDKRKKNHETTKEINQKIKLLVEKDICPILCIGEEKEELSDIKSIIDIELRECLNGITIDEIIIAYEPVWAIGSGKIPKQEKLADIIQYIKYQTEKIIGTIPIVVYGGSVNENTIAQLEEVKGLDGYLIGSASLDIDKLKKLIEVVK